MEILKVGSVLVSASGEASMDDGVRFYSEVLGFGERFRDGDLYAALACGDLTVALAAPPERPAGSGLALALKVDDLEAWHEHLAAAGSTVSDIVTGGHERRFSVTDPFGHDVVLYASA
jgi:catechol 2,3-dioxygenase-like lactoylglutathione lyase family enzyme